MANEKVVASLVGKLSWQVDNRPLATFEKRLDAVAAKMKSLVGLAKTKITIGIKLNEAAWKSKVGQLEKTHIKLSNVSVSSATLDAMRQAICTKLDKTKITIQDVTISPSSIIAARKGLQSIFDRSPVQVEIKPKWHPFMRSLTKVRKHVEKVFSNIAGKIGTIKIQNPKIQLKVDRQALKTEIAQVLAEIERTAKIKIQLNAGVTGGGGGAGGGRAFGGRHAMATGGIAGAAQHWGRGFIPGLSGAFAITQLNQLTQELRAQDLAMNAVMGGAQPQNPNAGAEQKAWVRSMSDTLGIVAKDAMPAFTKMLASGTTSGYGVGEVQNIFSGVSAYGRTMGLDQEAMKGTYRAIEQMMNKGQIMSEELKGQLAERAPGVISAMAEAAGFDPAKDPDAVAKLFDAMKEGKIKSKDVMEKFSNILLERAKAGGALEKAMRSVAAEQSRFTTAWHDAVIQFAEGGFENQMAEFFSNASKAMKQAEPLVRALGGAFELMMRPINAVINIVGELGERLPAMAQALGVSEKALVGLAGGALLAATPLGRIVLAVQELAMWIEDIIAFTEGRQSLIGELFKGMSDADQGIAIDLWNALKGMVEAFGKLFSMEGQGKTFFEQISEFARTTAKEITAIANAITAAINAINEFRGKAKTEVQQDVAGGGGWFRNPLSSLAALDAAHAQGREKSVWDLFNPTMAANRMAEEANSADRLSIARKINSAPTPVAYSPTVHIGTIQFADPATQPGAMAQQIMDQVDLRTKEMFKTGMIDMLTTTKSNFVVNKPW